MKKTVNQQERLLSDSSEPEVMYWYWPDKDQQQ